MQATIGRLRVVIERIDPKSPLTADEESILLRKRIILLKERVAFLVEVQRVKDLKGKGNGK